MEMEPAFFHFEVVLVKFLVFGEVYGHPLVDSHFSTNYFKKYDISQFNVTINR